MARRYGRAPRGERAIGSVPHGHWLTSTFIAGLRHDGIVAPCLFNCAIDGELFLAYVEQQLAPSLLPDDIVIADNLSSHKVAGVRELIEIRGAALRFLPPYSPDLNPIEQAFAKLKELLRAEAARTIDALWSATGHLLDLFTATNAQTISPTPVTVIASQGEAALARQPNDYNVRIPDITVFCGPRATGCWLSRSWWWRYYRHRTQTTPGKRRALHHDAERPRNHGDPQRGYPRSGHGVWRPSHVTRKRLLRT